MKLFKRSLCMLITILMILSMVPASVFAADPTAKKAQRPSDNWDVPEIEKADESKLQTETVSTFEELKTALEKNGDIKVTLKADISKSVKKYATQGRSSYPSSWPWEEYIDQGTQILYCFNTRYRSVDDIEIESSTIQVGAGQKYLDLNGYNIEVYDDSFTCGLADTLKRNLLTVTKGATLTLDDQSSGLGSILYTSSILPEMLAVRRDVFKVLNGGKLIVNGGSVEAGSSFKLYCNNIREVGYLDKSEKYNTLGEYAYDYTGAVSYYGYAYYQIWGSAVSIDAGGYAVINDGTFYGRGEGYAKYKIKDGSNLCRDAVIDGSDDAYLTINGGKFCAKGGAHLFYFGDENHNHDSKDNGAYVSINAGSFSLETLEGIRQPGGHVMAGSYGQMNIFDYYLTGVEGYADIAVKKNEGSSYQHYVDIPDSFGISAVVMPRNNLSGLLTVNHGAYENYRGFETVEWNPNAPLTLKADAIDYYTELDTMGEYSRVYKWRLSGNINLQNYDRLVVTKGEVDTIDPMEELGITGPFTGTLSVTCTVEDRRANSPEYNYSFRNSAVKIKYTNFPMFAEALPGNDIKMRVEYPESGDPLRDNWPVTITILPTPSQLNVEDYEYAQPTYYLSYINNDGEMVQKQNNTGVFQVQDLDYQHASVNVDLWLRNQDHLATITKELNLVRHYGYDASCFADKWGTWNADKTVFYPDALSFRMRYTILGEEQVPQDSTNQFGSTELSWYRQTGVNHNTGETLWELVGAKTDELIIIESGTYCVAVTGRDGEVVYNRPVTINFETNPYEFKITPNGVNEVMISADGTVESEPTFQVDTLSGPTNGTFYWKIVDGPEGWEEGCKTANVRSTGTTFSFTRFRTGDYDDIIPGRYTVMALREVEGQNVAVSNTVYVDVERKADTCEIYANGKQLSGYYQCDPQLVTCTVQFAYAPADGATLPQLSDIKWTMRVLEGTDVGTLDHTGEFTYRNPGRVAIIARGTTSYGNVTRTVIVDVPISNITVTQTDVPVEKGAAWTDILTVDPNAPYTLSIEGSATVGGNYTPDIYVVITPKVGYVLPLHQGNRWDQYRWSTTSYGLRIFANLAEGAQWTAQTYGIFSEEGPEYGTMIEDMCLKLNVQMPFVSDSDATYLEQLAVEMPAPHIGDSYTEEETGGNYGIPGATTSLTDEECYMLSSVSKVDSDAAADWDGSNDNAVYLTAGEQYEEGQLYRADFTLIPSKTNKLYFAQYPMITVNGVPTQWEDPTDATPGVLGENYLKVSYYFYASDAPEVIETVNLTGVSDPGGDIMPASFDSIKADHEDLEIVRMVWFVDANGNGKVDEGEDAAANFNQNGTFKFDEAYSILVELGLNERSEAVLAEVLTVNIGNAAAGYEMTVDGMSAVYTYEKPVLATEVWVGGVKMTAGTYLANGASAAVKSKPSGGYAYFNNGVLTLNNYDYTGEGCEFNEFMGFHATVYCEGNLRINLIGTNNLAQTVYGDFNVMVSDGSLTVEGTGNLLLQGGGFGLYANKNLIINGGSLDIYALCQALTVDYGSIVINRGELDVKSLETEYDSAWYAVSHEPVIAAGLLVQASDEPYMTLGEYNAEEFETYDRIVVTMPKIWVGGQEMTDGEYLANGATEATTVKPEGGYAYFKGGVLTLENYQYSGEGFYVDGIGEYAAIYATNDITISLEGENSIDTSDGSAFPVYAHECDVSFTGYGSLDLTAAAYAGVYATNSISVDDCTLNITTEDSGLKAYYGHVTINSGEINIDTDNGYEGIYADLNVYIYGGQLNIVAGTDGIYADDGNVLIEDGEINIDAYDEGIDVFASMITVNGGNLKILAGFYGMYSGADIAINGGTVQIDSEEEGIYAEYGMVTVRGGKTFVNSDYVGISTEGGIYVEGGYVDVRGTRSAVDSAPVFDAALPVQAATAVNGTLGEYVAADYSTYHRIAIGVLPAAAVARADGMQVDQYDTLAEAIDACRNGQHIVLLKNINDTMTVNEDLYVDLNGYSLEGLTVNGNLYAWDSGATVSAAGTGSVRINGNVVRDHDAAGIRYIALEENGAYTFHALEIRLTAVSLRTSEAGLYYKARINCDPVLRAAIDSHGVAVSLVDMPGAEFGADDLYTSISGAPTVGREFTSGAVFGIFKEGAADNAERGEMKIYANAYLKLKDGTVITSDTTYGDKATDKGFDGVAWSLWEVLSALDRSYASLDEETKADLKAFCAKWKDDITYWNLTNLQ